MSKRAIAQGFNRGRYNVGVPTLAPWFAPLGDPPLSGPPSYGGPPRKLSPAVIAELTAIANVVQFDEHSLAERTRDWWPGTMLAHSAGRPMTPNAASVAVSRVEQVQQILRLAGTHRLPVTVAAGRSNVVGAALPVQGGIVLDVTGLNRILSFNSTDLTVETEPGVFGDVLESHIQQAWGVTTGHWPSSFAISTVGGWIACRGAGQLSTRYGKIEDIVSEIDVVLASGELVTLGGTHRAAVGPDLRELVLGSEGTLGVITRAVLRTHHVPTYAASAAFTFESFSDGLRACQAIMQSGVTPAVMRLYDAAETVRHFELSEGHLLLLADEGHPRLVDTTLEISREAAAPFGTEAPSAELFEAWLDTRYNINAVAVQDDHRSVTADTLEIVGRWSALSSIYDDVLAAVGGVPGTGDGASGRGISAHLSHAYTDSASLYFTMYAVTAGDDRARWYRAAWDAAHAVILRHGAQLSHHHGVGLVRLPYLEQALGGANGMLRSVKRALDPLDLLNPGKLGGPSSGT